MSGAIDADRVESMSVDDAWAAVQTGLNYVSWLAREFVYTGVAREDLVAEGRIGLFEAALRFDPSHGAQFLTYASFWARRRMQTYVARHARVVRRPMSRAGTARDREDVSLDEPVGSSKTLAWRDVLVDRESPKVLDSLVGAEDAALITSAALELPPQWRAIIVRRFGLDGGPAMTLAAVGETLGLSRERVRQVEATAMRSLRDRLEVAWARRGSAGHPRSRSTLPTGNDHRGRQVAAHVQGRAAHVEEPIDP
jgi:RNA polymerase sigma factor (sigma-70 family)